MENKKVAIIISSYNQTELLKQCLSSLFDKTNYSNYRVFIIDDSGKNKLKELKKEFPNITLIINKKNYGFSISNNIGIETAKNDFNPKYFLLLNDDVKIIQNDWLSKLILTFGQHHKVGIVGCNILSSDMTLQSNGERLDTKTGKWFEVINPPKTCFPVDWIKGCCFLVSKEVIEEIGLLDERFSPFGFEETDYCIRASRKGFLLVTNPESEIIHFGGSTIKKNESIDNFYIVTKNKIRFMLLNFSFKWYKQFVTTELKILSSCFISKNNKTKLVNPNESISLLFMFLKANYINAISLPEIIKKREDRR